MKLLRSLEELDDACKAGVCMTIGVFDAVHRGHQALIRRAMEEAVARGARSLVFTFERHPLAVLAPAYCPPTVLQPEAKARIMESLGVDLCLMLPFTEAFAKTPSEAFVEGVISGRCRARHVLCGGNFTFGAQGKGTPALLREMGARLGFTVEVYDAVVEGHSLISSSRIRDTLLQGDVEQAAAMLTRPYGFDARVVTGDARGRQIGFPTANLEPREGQLIPADGVYAIRARVEGGAALGGMINIGFRPTFDGKRRSIEAHLFDFSGDLVGKTIEIEFIARVRDEQKFSGIDALVAQLKRDEAECRAILSAIAKKDQPR